MLKIKKLTLEDLEKSGEILGEVGDSLAGKAEVSIKDVVALITKRKLLRKFVGLIVVDEEGVFSAGNSVSVIREGAGTVTFLAGSGVTITSFGNKLAIAGQYEIATLIFKSASTAYLFGSLA